MVKKAWTSGDLETYSWWGLHLSRYLHFQQRKKERGYRKFEMIKVLVLFIWVSQVAEMVKNLPAIWETWVHSLGLEDPREKVMPTHSIILA